MDHQLLTVKKGSELSPAEIRDMNEIAHATNPAVPDDYIARYHLRKSDPVFYFLTERGKISAFQAFSDFRIQAPGDSRTCPAIYVRMSYKSPDAGAGSKDFARKTNQMYIRSSLGRFWMFRSFWVIFQTTNPRLYERTAKFFPEYYPHHVHPLSAGMQDFASDFLRDELGYSYGFDDAFLSHRVNDDELSTWPIDDVWESMYAAQSEQINQFFLDRGVVLRDEKGAYFWTGKGILFMGRYSLGKLLRKKVLRRSRPR